MTITQFLNALTEHAIKLILDGGEFRDCNGDCPLVALFNAGVDHCSLAYDNSDAEDAGQSLGLLAEEIDDIVGIADGEDADDFPRAQPSTRDDDDRLIRRTEILAGLKANAEAA